MHRLDLMDYFILVLQ